MPESLRDLCRFEDFQWIKGRNFTITRKPHYVLQQPAIDSSASFDFHLHSNKVMLDWN